MEENQGKNVSAIFLHWLNCSFSFFFSIQSIHSFIQCNPWFYCFKKIDILLRNIFSSTFCYKVARWKKFKKESLTAIDDSESTLRKYLCPLSLTRSAWHDWEIKGLKLMEKNGNTIFFLLSLQSSFRIDL